MTNDDYRRLASRRWLFCKWMKITRDDDKPYLDRLVILRTPWFNVYLHKFRGDDDECQHCHPWWFVTLILWGGYWEWHNEERCWRRPGSILFRPATWRHRIVRGKRTPVTLVLTGKRCRVWGFWTRKGFVPWITYSPKEDC